MIAFGHASLEVEESQYRRAGRTSNAGDASVIRSRIDTDTRRRAVVSRRILELHSHVELYESYSEFSERDADRGLVLVAHVETRILLPVLEDGAIDLPVIVYAERPNTSEVVDALQSGALDFLEWPSKRECLKRVLELAESDGRLKISQLRKRATAKRLVNSLSPRELDVLIGVVVGGSNKSIAINLGLSHRTVEIHRARMMRKLAAGSTGDAVRIALYAGLDSELEIAA